MLKNWACNHSRGKKGDYIPTLGIAMVISISIQQGSLPTFRSPFFWSRQQGPGSLGKMAGFRLEKIWLVVLNMAIEIVDFAMKNGDFP